MRNLLLLLLLANVLYFLWGKFVTPPEEAGVAVVQEDALGPPLQLADADGQREAQADASSAQAEDAASDPDAGSPDNPGSVDQNTQAADVGDATNDSSDDDTLSDIFGEEDTENGAESAPTTLLASTGRSCVTIGPFRENDAANEALAEYEADGMQGRLRTTQGEVFVGHWVQIRNLPNRSTANQMVTTLHDGGLGDAYIVETEEEGIKISLGLFGDLNGAERVELQAKSMDLPAEISPRMRNATIFFVDLGLPPGRGAGSMIEQFGEDRVLLRDQATCPRDN